MAIKNKKTVKARSKKMALSLPLQPISTYETDFYNWTKTQSELLKQGDLSHLDIENLIEEIESLGRSDKRALKSHLIILLMHLLKCEFQPSKKTVSWTRSINNSKTEIQLILDDSPSLKAELNGIIKLAYQYAKEKASDETGIAVSKFPKECPWKKEELI